MFALFCFFDFELHFETWTECLLRMYLQFKNKMLVLVWSNYVWILLELLTYSVQFKVPTCSIQKNRKCIAKHRINPRISAVWSTTKPIALFSCTPCVQEVHIKAEVVHPTPGRLGLGVIFTTQA